MKRIRIILHESQMNAQPTIPSLRSALNELMPMVYGELRRVAASHLQRERSSHTLQATSLVHETYLKLSEKPNGSFVSRAHFFAVASRVMRQILVDHARARSTLKRSSGSQRVSELEKLQIAADEPLEPLTALDLKRAMDALEKHDAKLARIIEMYYFSGMTGEEIAQALEESVHVVRHDIRYAQAWLRRELLG